MRSRGRPGSPGSSVGSPGSSMIRTFKRTALSTMKTAGVFGLASRTRWRNDRLLILAYHGVAQDDEHLWDPALFIPPELLEQRLRFLRAAGFNILPLGEAIDRLYDGSLPPRSVAITFDDGYVDFVRVAHPILQAYNAPSTVYLTTYYSEHDQAPPAITAGYMLWKQRHYVGPVTIVPGFDSVDLRDEACRQAVTEIVERVTDERMVPALEKQRLLETLAAEIGFDFAEFRSRRLLHLMTPDEARRMAAAGVDIQLHTHRHWVPNDEALIRREVSDNRVRIEDITARAANHFCYPSGVYYPELLPWLRTLGVRSATTCDSGLASTADDPLLLPRFLDHSGVSQVEFEAWATGIGAMLPRRSVPRGAEALGRFPSAIMRRS
jgi:peptidoglycan/xylan/chitin deacetylase (PgdA/CDA1 family)